MEETSSQLAPSCSEGGAGGVSQDGQLGQLAVAAQQTFNGSLEDKRERVL